MKTEDEKYRQHDIEFLISLNDDLFYAFEIEYQRRLLAAAFNAQAPQKNCGSKIMEVIRNDQ